jgi:hypothetical protein
MGPVAVAHNGNLINAALLRRQYEEHGHIFQSTTDTEIIVHLLAKPTHLHRADTLSHVLKHLQGSFSLLFLFPDRIEACRDPWGIRPLVLGKTQDGKWCVSSETCAFDAIDARYAVIGGHAVSLRGHPWLTLDVDFLTTDPRLLEATTWATLATSGALIDIRKGDFDDPLAGVVCLTDAEDGEAVVVVGKWKWEQAVIERAERLPFRGMLVPVARASDLVLLKLSAGGYVDLQDAYALLHAAAGRDELIREVDATIAALPREAQEAWKRIVSS